MKTVYITSYSTSKLSHDPTARAHLLSHLPSISPLLTLFCLHWRAPSAKICAQYSGVSPPVQNLIRGSRTAMREIDQAVLQIMTHLNAGNDAANVQVTCHAGTHRSVAAAEIIGQKLGRRGVRDVRVRHVHRRKREGDLV